MLARAGMFSVNSVDEQMQVSEGRLLDMVLQAGE
jgi:hypothetical protein